MLTQTTRVIPTVLQKPFFSRYAGTWDPLGLVFLVFRGLGRERERERCIEGNVAFNPKGGSPTNRREPRG